MSKEENIFKFGDSPTRTIPYHNNFHNAVTYELSDTHNTYFRQVYGLLDWLRDIGGLYGALSAIGIGLVSVF